MNKHKYSNTLCQNITKFGAVAFCTAGLLAGGVALAANVHFLDLDGVVDGETLTVTGTLAGLGNKDINITTTLDVDVSGTCNPPGNSTKEPQGINKKLQVEADQEISAEEFDNGRVEFEFEFDLDFDDEVRCPNKNWTADVEVDTIALTVDVDQLGGNDDITETCDVSCEGGSCEVDCSV